MTLQFSARFTLLCPEKHLKALLTKQRTTIEDIKAKTNYYSTRDLLDRYDDQPGTPGRRRKSGLLDPATPLRAPPPTIPGQPQPAAIPLSRESSSRLHDTPLNKSAVQRPMQPPKRQWYDRLADAVLGDEDPGAQPHSRYALICQSCFAHNGLVRESEWESTRKFSRSPDTKSLIRVRVSLPQMRPSQSLPA